MYKLSVMPKQRHDKLIQLLRINTYILLTSLILIPLCLLLFCTHKRCGLAAACKGCTAIFMKRSRERERERERGEERRGEEKRREEKKREERDQAYTPPF